MLVAYASGLRLTPLNRDRTVLMSFLTNAALELGFSDDIIHNVNPLRDPVSEREWLLVFAGVVYKARAAIVRLRFTQSNIVWRSALKVNLHDRVDWVPTEDSTETLRLPRCDEVRCTICGSPCDYDLERADCAQRYE